MPGTVLLRGVSTPSSYTLKKISYTLDVKTGIAVATLDTPANLNALRTL